MKQNLRFLRKISTHDHLSALKPARKLRHGTTSMWLNRSDEYTSWLKEPKSSVFWCSGILGSGKTVCAASVIDDLLCRRSTNSVISFFFCCYDNDKSLKANTIIRSLIRQALEANPSALNTEEVSQLLKADKFDIEDLKPLLLKLYPSSRCQYIVIDSVDECDKPEIAMVLDIIKLYSATVPAILRFSLPAEHHCGAALKQDSAASITGV